jgi:steroid delta-isomerase-like uncharacterized protein
MWRTQVKTFVLAAMASLFFSMVHAQTSTGATQNEQVVRRYYDALNRHDAHAAAAEFAEDAKNFGRSVGRKGIEDRLVDIFTTFPDWQMEIEDITSSGDDVVVRFTVTGTHQGVNRMALNGMPVGAPATGKRFEVGHTHWHKVRGGQIVEHYANRDDLGMLRQLGLLSVAASQ